MAMMRALSFRAGEHRVWPFALASLAGGLLLGATLVLVVPALSRNGKVATALPLPAEHIAGKGRSGPKLGGDLFTTIKAFSLEDPEGHTVLKVAELGGVVDLDAFGASQVVRMSRGHAKDVQLLLRRGPSGRVSLSEAFHGNSERHEPRRQKGGMPLQIGPLEVTDVDMTVAMGSTPVVIHIDRAIVRVQRKQSDLAPRIFLTAIHGKMVSPDPLPQPIAIEGGEGVIDLAGGPLVDLRTRVCIGNSELRVRIEMPERQERVQLTVDATGPLAKSALVALNVVSLFKSGKLGVEAGSIEVTEPFECQR